jgi:hypothetical protein
MGAGGGQASGAMLTDIPATLPSGPDRCGSNPFAEIDRTGWDVVDEWLV